MITICTTLVGLEISNKIKLKADICDQLIGLSNMLLIDFKTKMTPCVELIDELVKLKSFDKLDFINSNMIIEYKIVNSVLSEEENDKITNYIYSLGKSDLNSQIRLTEGFKEYIKNAKNKYLENYNKYKKLYLTVGFLTGLFISITFV